MAKYINAEILSKKLGRFVEYDDDGEQEINPDAVFITIDEMPSADVVEVKHGEWQITDAYPHNVYCSECHKRFAQTHWAVWEDGSLPRNFCPNCGADMRGETE